MNLIGLDYLGISQYFSDEELLVQKSCREFVDNEVLPIIEKHFKDLMLFKVILNLALISFV